MTKEEAITFIKQQSPSAFLQAAKKRGYVCPLCNNGTGKNGDGIVKVPGTNNYICFKCNWHGDLLDLIGITYGLTSFPDKLNKAMEIYGISIDNPAFSGKKKQQAVEMITKLADSSVEKDLTDYFNKCHSNVSATQYFKERGISQNVVDKFNLGYDNSFNDSGKIKYPMQAIILPTSSQTFEARNIAAKKDGFRYYKHGPATLFNMDALATEKEKPIVIVEGIIDALSVIEAGGQAIGLSSAVNYKLLVSELKKIIPEKPLALLFDSDETGAANEKHLSEELDKLKIPYLSVKEVIEGFHDPNERLLKDRVGLEKAIITAYEKIADLPDPKEEAKREYLKTSAGNSLNAFMDFIIKNMNRPTLSTGFKAIDDALGGGLFTGLYFVGGISSLGKTTLSLQIADNLAKQGQDVLFFTLEQSKFELMSKSISRETYLACIKNRISVNCAKSNLAILDGHRLEQFSEKEEEVFNTAYYTYEKFAQHVFIYEGVGNISVEEISEKVKNHISITGNDRPIVFIDYLQILKPVTGDERATDKQVVDHNVTALKQLSRDFDIPIIAVSSLNRLHYDDEITMAAFKESGAIEYGSDVLIGLQLTGVGENDFDVAEAKEKTPREVDFCILKNRNGRITQKGIPMHFNQICNCFESDGGNLPRLS